MCELMELKAQRGFYVIWPNINWVLGAAISGAVVFARDRWQWVEFLVHLTRDGYIQVSFMSGLLLRAPFEKHVRLHPDETLRFGLDWQIKCCPVLINVLLQMAILPWKTKLNKAKKKSESVRRFGICKGKPKEPSADELICTQGQLCCHDKGSYSVCAR